MQKQVWNPFQQVKPVQTHLREGFLGFYRRPHSSISPCRERQDLSLGCQRRFQLRDLNRRSAGLNSTAVSRNSRAVSLNSTAVSGDFLAVRGGFLSVSFLSRHSG